MQTLTVQSAEDLAKRHGLSRVLLIAVDDDGKSVYTVSYGKTKIDCGLAAMDVQKLRAVLEAQPTSLVDAIEAAKLVRPEDIKNNRFQRIISELLDLISKLDEEHNFGWNSITTPDVVVEASSLISNP